MGTKTSLYFCKTNKGKALKVDCPQTKLCMSIVSLILNDLVSTLAVQLSLNLVVI